MKDAYYFPHFCNARNDEKILKIRRVFGMEGYGLYFALLEALREKKDFTLPLSSIEDFAYDWHVSKEKILSIVADFDLFEIREDNFFSPKLVEFIQPYLEGKERKRIGGIKGNLIKSGIITKDQADKMTPEEIDEIENKRKNGFVALLSHTDSHREAHTDSHREKVSEQVCEEVPLRSASQKKGKEKKGKEKKDITHSKNASESIYSFESFWNDYGKKIDRKKCRAIYDKLSEKDREDIYNSIGLYVIAYPEKKFRKNPLTYLNGRCWEDDIVDILESRKVDDTKRSNPTPTTKNNLKFL